MTTKIHFAITMDFRQDIAHKESAPKETDPYLPKNAIFFAPDGANCATHNDNENTFRYENGFFAWTVRTKGLFHRRPTPIGSRTQPFLLRTRPTKRPDMLTQIHFRYENGSSPGQRPRGVCTVGNRPPIYRERRIF